VHAGEARLHAEQGLDDDEVLAAVTEAAERHGDAERLDGGVVEGERDAEQRTPG
jgi:hypothetical protein